MATGIESFKTCQCAEGYEPDEEDGSGGEMACVESVPETVPPLDSFEDSLDDLGLSGFEGCVGVADCGDVDNIECRLSRINGSQFREGER